MALLPFCNCSIPFAVICCLLYTSTIILAVSFFNPWMAYTAKYTNDSIHRSLVSQWSDVEWLTGNLYKEDFHASAYEKATLALLCFSQLLLIIALVCTCVTFCNCFPICSTTAAVLVLALIAMILILIAVVIYGTIQIEIPLRDPYTNPRLSWGYLMAAIAAVLLFLTLLGGFCITCKHGDIIHPAGENKIVMQQIRPSSWHLIRGSIFKSVESSKQEAEGKIDLDASLQEANEEDSPVVLHSHIDRKSLSITKKSQQAPDASESPPLDASAYTKELQSQTTWSQSRFLKTKERKEHTEPCTEVSITPEDVNVTTASSRASVASHKSKSLKESSGSVKNSSKRNSIASKLSAAHTITKSTAANFDSTSVSNQTLHSASQSSIIPVVPMKHGSTSSRIRGEYAKKKSSDRKMTHASIARPLTPVPSSPLPGLADDNEETKDSRDEENRRSRTISRAGTCSLASVPEELNSSVNLSTAKSTAESENERNQRIQVEKEISSGFHESKGEGGKNWDGSTGRPMRGRYRIYGPFFKGNRARVCVSMEMN